MSARRPTQKLLFAAVTFAFTAFVFINTYEVVFNRDVAFAQSIKKVAAQDVINDAVTDFSAKITSDNSTPTAPMENIDSLEILSLKLHATVEESRKVGNKWYQRPSAGHYVGLNKDQANNTVDYLIYTSKSWRTVPNPEQIEQGMEVRIAHDGGVATFQIAEKKVLPLDHSLLVGKSEDRQLLLVIEDPANNLYYGYSLVPQR